MARRQLRQPSRRAVTNTHNGRLDKDGAAAAAAAEQQSRENTHNGELDKDGAAAAADAPAAQTASTDGPSKDGPMTRRAFFIP